MKGIFAALTILAASVFTVSAQKNETLLTIGNSNISVDEFMHIYKKNNSSDFETKKAKDYIDLFVNFKLKVIEAENLKMDTSADFRNELTGYRDQLAKPYMTENAMIEKLAKESYERSKTEVKLDHILIKVSEQDDSKDTLAAYDKAQKIIQRLNSGEDFEKVARETSEDRSVERTGGHLWYLPISTMPYSLQKFASTAKIKELSSPLRSQFGYHILRLIDKRPAHDQVLVAHIMVACPESLTDAEKAVKKARIDSIYNQLKNGKDFNFLCKLSDDKGSSTKGGELPWFGTGRMVPEFEQAAFGIKNKGDYTQPIKTAFGWHIIKLIDTKPVPTYDEDEKNIKNTIEKDPEREKIIKNYVTTTLKNTYNFKQINTPINIYSVVDSTVFKGSWIAEKDTLADNLLFTIGNKKYTEKDFARYLESNQTKMKAVLIENYVNEKYSDFIYQSLTSIEKDGLEEKNPEFKYLMQEYHDGILLFDLTDKAVWSKAVKDSVGLHGFYEKNKEDYRVQTKVDLSIFKYSDKNILKKAQKTLENKQNKNLTDDQVVSEVGNSDKFKLISAGVFSKNDNPEADWVIKGIKDGSIKKDQPFAVNSDNNIVVYINKVIDSEGKPFDEIKGLVISDYQNFLEKLWIDSLKKKYPVKINEDVLNKIN
jgi:peptidyl-prolyl cis-trans isomerase SurA